MPNPTGTVDAVLALLDELERILQDVRSAARDLIETMDDDDMRREQQ